jgi:IS30 family transposase
MLYSRTNRYIGTPEIIEKKIHIGDWESDSIIEANNQGVISRSVDHHEKFVLHRNIRKKYARGVVEAFILYTIAFDHGKEFAGHEKIASMLHSSHYFERLYDL